MNAQAEAWAGEFGNDYAKRSPGSVEANAAFFARIIASMEQDPASVIEFGAGVGNNLRALRRILPKETLLQGIEINSEAFVQLHAGFPASVQSALQDWFVPAPGHDLAFTKGVLIHIPPVDLPRAYAALYGNAKKYVLVAEYYCPQPREILYRGQKEMLWARDFAGEMLAAYPDLRLVDYGFVYHRDAHPQDDLNWFLMEKR